MMGATDSVSQREIDQRFDALHKLLDERADADRRAVEAALKAVKEGNDAALTSTREAVGKAEEAQQRVNETQNEFRGALKDQAATLMPRAESEALHHETRRQIDDLRGRERERRGGEQGRGLQTGMLLTVADLVLAGVSAAVVVTR